MLGEAAWTKADADRYFLAYKHALTVIGKSSDGVEIIMANGISVKLSALHPTYNFAHKGRVLKELVPRIIELVKLAEKYNIAINIDAEESERLDISLDVIGAIMNTMANSKWSGLGLLF